MESKTAYEQNIEARLAEIGAEVDKLEARAREASADAQVTIEDQLETLKAKKDATARQLATLKASSASAWEDLRGGVQNAFDDLLGSVEDARSHF